MQQKGRDLKCESNSPSAVAGGKSRGTHEKECRQRVEAKHQPC